VRRVVSIAVVVGAMCSAAWGAPEPTSSMAEGTEGRLGWHGELMPKGVERAPREGEYLWSEDGAVMVFVPAGDFMMGSRRGQADEQPVRRIWLDGYYIDKHEVSWARWKGSGLPYSEQRSSRRPWPEAPDWGIRDDEPVVMVSWDWARRYAEWAGKRLPTEAEWEKAARGTDERTWPWGDESPTFARAVWRYHPTARESIEKVDCCAAGASPYGALNMAGNAYEWCEDVYDARAYAEAEQRNPVRSAPGPYRVLRGGAFLLELEDLRSALRYRLFSSDRGDYIGFRTVLSAVPVSAPARSADAVEADGSADRTRQ